jgi:GNAT superfamily N-acetyltransferase
VQPTNSGNKRLCGDDQSENERIGNARGGESLSLNCTPAIDSSLEIAVGTVSLDLVRQMHQDSGLTGKLRDIQSAVRPQQDVAWFIAKLGGSRPIGLFRLHVVPPHVAFLAELMVSKRFHNQGIGTQLMNHAEAFCIVRQVERLALKPTASSRSFYERLGYCQDPQFKGVWFKLLNRPTLITFGATMV